MIYKHNQEFVKWREGMRDSVNGYTERDAFEAGQQSQQAKIDELQDEIQGYKRIYGELELKRDELNADFRKVGMALATATKEAIIWMDKSKKSDFINQGLELKIDELQVRIDEARKSLFERGKTKEYRIDKTSGILKGNKDETGFN